MLDADTSYLDEAINAPAVPSRDPGKPAVSYSESCVERRSKKD